MSTSSSPDARRATGWGIDGPLVLRFPEPARLIRIALAELQLASETQPDASQVAKLAQLPKPWDPSTCTGQVRRELWEWLEQVADWINTQHLWSVGRTGIPPCWPAHPHVVHDLAVIASTRYLATYVASPVPLETWQRLVLPAFLDRMSERLAGGCQVTHPVASPRADRDRDYRSGPAATERLRAYAHDAEQTEPGHDDADGDDPLGEANGSRW